MGYSEFKRTKTNPITDTLIAVQQHQSKSVFNYLTNSRTIYVQTPSGLYLYDNLPDEVPAALEVLQLAKGDRAAISRSLPRSEYFRELASVLILTKTLTRPVTVLDCKSIRNLTQFQVDALARLPTGSTH